MSRIRIVIILIVLTALAVIVVLQKGRGKKKYNWYKNYRDEVANPYELGAFRKMLQAKSKNFVEINELSIRSTFKSKLKKSNTYVSIGESSYLNSRDVTELMTFLKNGNDAIIICEYFPRLLLNELMSVGTNIETDMLRADTVTAKVLYNNRHSDSFLFVNKVREGSEYTDWPVFSTFPGENVLNHDYMSEDGSRQYITLGRLNDQPDFIAINIEGGRLYLHSNPQLFTNQALTSKEGYQYLNDVFKGIPLENTFYDVSSRYPKNESEERGEGQTPLSYILSQPSLRLAWYMLMLTAVLFFLFRARRKQNVIPVLEKKKNSSLQFIRTLGELFYTRAVNKEMAKIATNGLMFFIRNKLNVSTRNMDESKIELIALRSGHSLDEVRELFNACISLANTQQTDITSRELMSLENKINKFYQSFNNKKQHGS